MSGQAFQHARGNYQYQPDCRNPQPDEQRKKDEADCLKPGFCDSNNRNSSKGVGGKTYELVEAIGPIETDVKIESTVLVLPPLLQPRCNSLYQAGVALMPPPVIV